MLLKRIVYFVQVVVSVRSTPKSFEHEVQTPPVASVLRSGILTRTALLADDEPFLAKNEIPAYFEAL